MAAAPGVPTGRNRARKSGNFTTLALAMTGPATFRLFVRNLPSERGFLVAAELESALDFLSCLRVGPEDVNAFARRCTGRRDLEPLLGLEFTGRVRAAPEGRIVLAGEPLLKADVSAGGRTPGVVGPVGEVLRDRDHAVNAPAQPLDDGDQALDLDGSTEGDLPLAYLDPHF